MTATIYTFQPDGVKCGFCNFQVTNHHIVGDTREEAIALAEEGNGDGVDRKGFCGDCLIHRVLDNDDIVVSGVEPLEE